MPTVIGAATAAMNHFEPNGILIAIVMVMLVIANIVWFYSRSRSVLEQWAEENGFELLETDQRHLFRGPFFWTTTKGQSVYRVVVRDSSGRVRRGWVRCGSFWFGLMSSKAMEKWDDE